MDTTGKRSVESGEADFGPPLFRMASDDFETRSASTRVRGSLGRGGLPQGGEEEGVEAESKPTTPRHVDQFGFWVDGKEPEASKEDRLKQARDERHVRRWRNMIGVGGGGWKKYSKRHPKDVKRRIRKGIPDRLRGLVRCGRQQLVFYETSSSELDIIRDINRTFPSHVFFQQRHGPGQRSLYNVLKAYSVYDTAVGYTQGMGFLAGLLLLYMGEEDAFWLLSGLPLVQQYLFQFDQLVHEVLPRLGAHFDREGITPSMYASQWFITVFSYSFPFPTALRIWDVFLYEADALSYDAARVLYVCPAHTCAGMKIVFRVGLALLKNCQEQLLELPFEGLVHALRNFSSTSLDPDVLLPMAFSIKVRARCSVSKRLEELRRQYLGLQTPSPSKSSVPESPRSRSSGSGLTPLTSPVAVRALQKVFKRASLKAV
eukprot:jgi/Mesen1/3594/ME000020S03126